MHNLIKAKQEPISNHFITLGMTTFYDVAKWVENLPYKRNTDKDDPTIVLTEKQGTCSTKHALLKRFVDENSIDGIQLMMGIFKLNAKNTPAIKDILSTYNLNYIPEAHIYLQLDKSILDFTGLPTQEQKFSDVLLMDLEISPNQINTFKIDFHKQYIESWIEVYHIPYHHNEIWEIREKCIQELINSNTIR